MVLAAYDMRIADQSSFLSGRLDDAGRGPGWSDPQIPQVIMAIRIAYILIGRNRGRRAGGSGAGRGGSTSDSGRRCYCGLKANRHRRDRPHSSRQRDRASKPKETFVPIDLSSPSEGKETSDIWASTAEELPRVRHLWQRSVFGGQIVDAQSFMPAVWG